MNFIILKNNVYRGRFDDRVEPFDIKKNGVLDSDKVELGKDDYHWNHII